MKTLLSILFSFSAISFCFAQPKIKADPDRIEKRINELSQFGKNPQGGVSRTGFSDADINARKYIITLMQEMGLQVTIDAGGNIIGQRKGKDNTLPPIVFGSHIDSVPLGGNYDGDVGVIGALECIDLLNQLNLYTKHPLEVVVFSDEEGGLTGSQAMIGILKADDLDRISNSGKSVGQGIKDIGGDPQNLHLAKREKGEIAAFLELHIEQGAILDTENINIGVVEGIVGLEVWEITIEGKANHAGTTPMNLRQDALLSGAKLVIAINETVRSIEGTQVGTVGKIDAKPGAPNVIPGKVTMSLEIRDLSREKMFSVLDKIKTQAALIEKETETKISFKSKNLDIYPALSEKRIQKVIADSAKELGYSSKYMPSFAGHDAQDLAKIAPMGMIFVPSKDGISHSPYEFTATSDIANGASVLLRTILKIDK
ncbi:hydantoinase/carbamoylase family amidase [Flavobacteriaceae bacterium R38]|nr:hydantoinase/carbamoylase family amidase [Flavobacteriaceae bacterium R38]